VVVGCYLGSIVLTFVIWKSPISWRFAKVELSLSEEIRSLSEKGIEHQDYESPIQRILRKPIPVPEASRVEGKQEVILAERGEIITDFGMPEVRVLRLKDKEHLPQSLENEIPDKIEIEGDTVVYVFRVRPWLRRIR
jgi:hypothetical protein